MSDVRPIKGIIFNLAEEVLSQAHGSELWDQLLERTGLEGSYTSLGSYPDEDLVKLLVATADTLGVTTDDVLRALGEGALPLLAERYAPFFANHTSARSFVLTVNDIIHPEVRKLYPGADVPEFDFETPDEFTLILGYRSTRKLCALAEGFVVGAATHYGEHVDIDQPQCMHKGASQCLIRCVFRSSP